MSQNSLAFFLIISNVLYDYSLTTEILVGKFRRVADDMRRVTGIFADAKISFESCLNRCLQNSTCEGFNTNSTIGISFKGSCELLAQSNSPNEYQISAAFSYYEKECLISFHGTYSWNENLIKCNPNLSEDKMQPSEHAPLAEFRPPSVPLIMIDPYINIWSTSNNLYDDWPKYWSGQIKAFSGMIRVDGDSYRFMGPNSDQINIGAVNQISVTVWPTRTIYEFDDPQQRVRLIVQFTTPLLPQRWDVSSRPITYITYTIKSLDGSSHSVQLYSDNTAELVVNDVKQKVTWRRIDFSTLDINITALEIGTVSQGKFDVRDDTSYIDWGYAYTAVQKDSSVSVVVASAVKARSTFISTGTIPTSDDRNAPRAANIDWPILAVAWNINLGATGEISKFLTFAYDDLFSIRYFNRDLKPYWRRPSGFADITFLLSEAISDYSTLLMDCEEFDRQTYQELRDKGGDEYATLASIVYRQTMAASKLVWHDKLELPYAFQKSIATGGSLNMVRVIFKSAPLFIYHDPEYLQCMLLPLLSYSNNETGNSTFNFKSKWAPSNLGTYPVADILSTQQLLFPMDEAASMLIMLAAVTQQLGYQSTNVWYPMYWSILKGWADYLVTALPDPGIQPSVDDLIAPSQHNANLALKGIIGLGAFSELCRIIGSTSDQTYYLNKAKAFASKWLDLAIDGDHYKLQYDAPKTWSLKSNFLFDKALGLNIFSDDVIQAELTYYLNNWLNPYGLPLDSRSTFGKLEVTSLVAALAADVNGQKKIFNALYKWANSTLPLAPLCDWYDTVAGNRSNYIARPVVGGLYGFMIV